RNDDLVRKFQRMREILAVQTGCRIQNQPARPARHVQFIVILGVEAQNYRTIRWPHGKPAKRRMLTIQVPQKYLVFPGGERTSQIGGERRLSGSAFWIGDEDGLHNLLFSANQPYAPALAAPARPSRNHTVSARSWSRAEGASVSSPASGRIAGSPCCKWSVWSVTGSVSTKAPKSSKGGNSSRDRRFKSSRKVRVVE